MTVMRRLLLLGCALLFGDETALGAQSTSGGPCDAPEHRQFDFWLGAWTVTTPDGKPAGKNLIQSIADGCALSEHWQGAKGGEGFSHSAYDATRKSWHQTWVDHDGLVLLIDGHFANGSMVLQGRQGKTLNRITWTPRKDGTVRQLWESSVDKGKTWELQFDGTYTRDAKADLEAMYRSDQDVRREAQELDLKAGGRSSEAQVLWMRQQRVDQFNQKRLDEIVTREGWPTISKFGIEAAQAAFLVVQHSNLEMQDKYLPLMRDAVAKGEAVPQQLPLLEDRVRVGHGQKQLYGSQLEPDGKGGWKFQPIEDEAHVDERRKAVGLEPLAEYAKGFGIEYRPKN